MKMKRLFNVFPFLQGNRRNSGYEQFLEDFPAYAKTQALDELRRNDFSRLDEQKHIYLDYTGGQLYGERLVKQHQEFLAQNILGNPHSINPSSALAEKHIQASRKKVLEFFNATEDYICIFTANCSAALKIVGECYPFNADGQFLMTFDNHNSVNGIREFARTKDCPFHYSPLDEHLRIKTPELEEKLARLDGKNKLFAFPAQSNVSGVKHNLEWIEEAQSLGWDVLLDAAAFVPTSRLDLFRYQPEFVALSFYKMFGYPTGLGALLVKKSAYQKLRKPSFAGGTITIVSVQGDGHHLEKEAARFEEGTVDYLGIPAIKKGLEYLESVGMDHIGSRISCLTQYLLNELKQMRHSNGQRLIELYGPTTSKDRGGTIVMNFRDPFKRLHNFIDIEKAAFERNISLRTGCFCNPGIDETNHNLQAEKLQAYFKKEGEKDYFNLIEFLGQKRGAVRISLGFVTNYEDISHFLDFCKGYLDKEVEV